VHGARLDSQKKAAIFKIKNGGTAKITDKKPV
jgi:hypothetical protein